MHEQRVHSGYELYGRIAVQLAGSYLVAGVAGLLLEHWLSLSGIAPLLVFVLTLVGSLGTGLLLSTNLQYGLFLLDLSLTRLVEGNTITISRSAWYWSLNPLFRSIDAIAVKSNVSVQREQIANDYREQLLQQASEAAATKERNRLARELHDSIKQQLFSIRMSAIAACGHLQGSLSQAQEAIEDIQKSVHEAQVEMQALLQQLRMVALEHTTLLEAIQTQAQALEFRSGAQVSVKIADLPALAYFPSSMQEDVFRIIQEAFANIARHARAQHVCCTITCQDQSLELCIEDDGHGFDSEHVRSGMGLANIQERALALKSNANIISAAGTGTTIQLYIPLLLPPAIKHQQEQQEAEAQRMVTRIQGWLHLASIVGIFTLFLLLLNIVLSFTRTFDQGAEVSGLLLSSSLLLLLSSLITIHFAITRLAIYRNRQGSEVPALRFQEHMRLTNFWRLSLFSGWHIVLWGVSLTRLAGWGKPLEIFLVFTLLLFSLILLGQYRFKQAQGRYFVLLEPDPLRQQIKDGERNLRSRIALALFLLVTLIVNNAVFFRQPVMPGAWLMYYLLFAFFVICLCLMMDRRNLQQWKMKGRS